MRAVTYHGEDRVAVIIRVGAPALSISRISSGVGAIPRPDSGLGTFEESFRDVDIVDVCERKRCERAERDEVSEGKHFRSSEECLKIGYADGFEDSDQGALYTPPTPFTIVLSALNAHVEDTSTTV